MWVLYTRRAIWSAEDVVESKLSPVVVQGVSTRYGWGFV